MLNQALQLANYENGVEYKGYTRDTIDDAGTYYEYSQCGAFW